MWTKRIAKPMLSRITIQIIMVFGPSMSKESEASSLLWLATKDLSLDSVLGSAFGAGLMTIAVASICLGAVFASSLGAGFGDGAGLGCRFSAGLVSALLDGLLTSLDSTLLSDTDGTLSWTDGVLSGLCAVTLGSGVAALEDILAMERGASSPSSSSSSSSGEMRLFLAGAGAAEAAGAAAGVAEAAGTARVAGAAGAARGGVMSGSLMASNFCRGLISRSEPCSFLMLWRLGVRDGPWLLEATVVSEAGAVEAGAVAGAEAEDTGVVGRLLGLLLDLLLLLLPPPPFMLLSSVQLPGLRNLESSLVRIVIPGLGEGVRPGEDSGMRWSSSFMTGLSGGVGSGSSSANSGSCITGSVFSLPSMASCNALFFRYSGPGW